VHKAYSDSVIKALIGPRDGIPAALKEGVATIHNAAVQ
jgi:hypothetical protein